MSLALAVASHPLLDAGAFVTRFARPLGECVLPEVGEPPMGSDDAVRAAVRDLLRAGGFKPSGRSKPASEYLMKTMPTINPAVDACNYASLYSGLPISVLDVAKLDGEALRIDVAPEHTSYVFNPSGQTIDAGLLLCVFDASGPTGTPVKDAQRTKTSPETRATLSVVWGTTALPGRTAALVRWYRGLLERIDGVTTESL